MSRRINKVAVLGSGVMGMGIAALFANIGLEVVVLDIVPFDLSEEDKKNPAKRNRMAASALEAAVKAKGLEPFTMLNMHRELASVISMTILAKLPIVTGSSR